MKNTWLVNNVTYSQKIFDLLAYYDYLLKYNILFFSYLDLLTINFFNSCFYILKYFIREMNSHINFSTNKTRTKNKFIRLKPKTFLTENNKLRNVKFTLKNLNSKIVTNFTIHGDVNYFFNAFFLMNQVPLAPQQSLHHNFYLFGASKTRIKAVTIEPKKFFKKWQEIHLLLSNFCYFNHIPLIYSSVYFKRETISLNWHLGKFNMITWRHIYPLFLTKTTIYSHKLNYVFDKLKQLKLSFALINDCEHHYKLLYYFNSYKWYTIGLVPDNIDPWLVSFALPVMQNNFFMQFFFIKFFVLVRKMVLFQKFVFQRNLWFQYYLQYLNQKQLKI